MEYPYTKGNLDNIPKYFYSNPNIFGSWWKSRKVVCDSIKKDIDKFVKKLELAKGYKIADLIIDANILEKAYVQFENIIYLNTFIKCIDMLCSVKDDLDTGQKMYLCELINKEREHILFERERI